MKVVLYADVIFFVNVCYDILLFVTYCFFTGRRIKPVRLLLCGGAGGFLGTVVSIVFIRVSAPVRILGMAAILVLISIGAFGREGLKQALQGAVSLFAFSCFLSGIMEFVLNSFSRTTRFQTGLWSTELLMPMGFGVIFAGMVVKRNRRITSSEAYFYQVILVSRDCEVKATGLLDSGNCLYEPIFGTPVILANTGKYQQLAAGAEEKTVIVPYRAVGTSSGLLIGVRIEEIRILMKNGIIKREKVVVCDAGNQVASDNRYSVILHPALFN